MRRKIAHIKQNARSWYEHFSIMAFGKPAKTRFIILTSPRSGSNLLSKLLHSHQNIVMYPEIFNLFAVSRTDLDRILTDPQAYLKTFYEKKNLPSKAAVGFKIFYSQANEIQLRPDLNLALCLPEPGERWKKKVADVQNYLKHNHDTEKIAKGFKEAWNFLKSDTSIKIIHLTRKNKLKQFLSLYRASLTDRWKSYDKNKLEDKPLFLKYEDCINFFCKYRSWEREFDEIFYKHNKMPIIYEDFEKNKNKVLTEVQDFLGVPIRRDLSTSLEKQGRKPLQDAIANYDELKIKFKNSKWENFFED